MEFIIIGPSGTGKSTLATAIIRRVNPRKKLIIVLDISDYYHHYIPSYYFELNEEKAAALTEASLLKIFGNAGSQDKGVVFNFESLPQEQTVQTVDKICRVINKRLKNTLLVMDEAYHLSPRFQGSHELLKLLRTGRKKSNDTVIIFQQFSDTDTATIRQANYLWVFKTQGVSEVKTAAKTLDISEAEVQQLPKYYYFIKNMRTNEISLENVEENFSEEN